MAKKFTLEVTEKQLDLLIGVLREAGGIHQTPAFLRRVNVLLDQLGRLRMRTSAAPRAYGRLSSLPSLALITG
jgi:hypothetical protein